MLAPEKEKQLKKTLEYFELGRFKDGAALCRALLPYAPELATTLTVLGSVHLEQGDLPASSERLGKSFLLNRSEHTFHYSIGQLHDAIGDFSTSASHYEKAIALRPDWPPAIFASAYAYERAGLVQDAESRYRDFIRLAPGQVEGYTNLGIILGKQGRLDESLACLTEAFRLDSDIAEVNNSLGVAYLLKGRLNLAEQHFLRAISQNPALTLAFINLAEVQRKTGHFDKAILLCQRAASLQPALPAAYVGLGAALAANDKLDEARLAYLHAIQLEPQLGDAHSALGYLLSRQGSYHAAFLHLRKAIELLPHSAIAYSNLAAANSRAGYFDDAIKAYGKALDLAPDAADVHSGLLFLLNADDTFAAGEIFVQHQNWDKRHSSRLEHYPHASRNESSETHKLRIGYVSADFKAHSIAYFLEPLLAAHDRTLYEIFCYSNATVPDEITRRFRALADHWRHTAFLSDADLAKLIRDDSIDILVDLSVHSVGNRLLSFARKPAPVQVTYLGYPGTTGLSAMDYKLSDAFLDPPGASESFHSEQIIRLPVSYFCYRPHGIERTVGPLPAESGAGITYCVFQALPKIRPSMLRVWSQVLKRTHNSCLRIKALGLHEKSRRIEFQNQFEDLGISAERLHIEGWSNFSGYLGALQASDIALDTYPFNGGTTTCHTLWMGVPVVTLAGSTSVSRMGLSILSQLGLQQLVASTPSDYVNIAVALGNDIPRLSLLRRQLRERMARSPLMDASRFARDVENAYRHMWGLWCQSTRQQSA